MPYSQDKISESHLFKFIFLWAAGLVIEVDGDIHDLQQEEDARREKALREMGLQVVRFGNEEVMKDAPRSAVLGKIHELVESHAISL